MLGSILKWARFVFRISIFFWGGGGGGGVDFRSLYWLVGSPRHVPATSRPCDMYVLMQLDAALNSCDTSRHAHSVPSCALATCRCDNRTFPATQTLGKRIGDMSRRRAFRPTLNFIERFWLGSVRSALKWTMKWTEQKCTPNGCPSTLSSAFSTEEKLDRGRGSEGENHYFIVDCALNERLIQNERSFDWFLLSVQYFFFCKSCLLESDQVNFFHNCSFKELPIFPIQIIPQRGEENC